MFCFLSCFQTNPPSPLSKKTTSPGAPPPYPTACTITLPLIGQIRPNYEFDYQTGVLFQRGYLPGLFIQWGYLPGLFIQWGYLPGLFIQWGYQPGLFMQQRYLPCLFMQQRYLPGLFIQWGICVVYSHSGGIYPVYLCSGGIYLVIFIELEIKRKNRNNYITRKIELHYTNTIQCVQKHLKKWNYQI